MLEIYLKQLISKFLTIYDIPVTYLPEVNKYLKSNGYSIDLDGKVYKNLTNS